MYVTERLCPIPYALLTLCTSHLLIEIECTILSSYIPVFLKLKSIIQTCSFKLA